MGEHCSSTPRRSPCTNMVAEELRSCWPVDKIEKVEIEDLGGNHLMKGKIRRTEAAAGQSDLGEVSKKGRVTHQSCRGYAVRTGTLLATLQYAIATATTIEAMQCGLKFGWVNPDGGWLWQKRRQGFEVSDQRFGICQKSHNACRVFSQEEKALRRGFGLGVSQGTRRPLKTPHQKAPANVPAAMMSTTTLSPRREGECWRLAAAGKIRRPKARRKSTTAAAAIGMLIGLTAEIFLV